MPLTLVEFGALQLKVRHTVVRRGAYYYRRRIPDDMLRNHPRHQNGYVFYSLQTRDPNVAAKKAHAKSLELDAQWEAWRAGSTATTNEIKREGERFLASFSLEPGDHKRVEGFEGPVERFEEELRWASQTETFQEALKTSALPPHLEHAAKLYYGEQIVPTLSEAVSFYQHHKGLDPNSTNEQARAKKIRKIVGLIGDLPINQYTRTQANSLVATLRTEGLKSQTVRRYLNYLTPVVKTTLREQEIGGDSPFEELNIPNLGEDSVERKPFSDGEVRLIQSKCMDADDDMRWAIALISDTGMRLSEALGLNVEHLITDAAVPHVVVEPIEGRKLKTKSSERKIPLVGASLWAAERLVSTAQSHRAVPRYWRSGKLKSTSASNTFNNYLRREGFDKTMHSLRHSMRDRLRNAGVEEEVNDQLGGWSKPGVGRGYGQGYNLEYLHRELQKIVLV